ncbi:hypothetical protein [Mucilaginibacter sp. HD30]
MLISVLISCKDKKQVEWDNQAEKFVATWEHKKFSCPKEAPVFNDKNGLLKYNQSKPYKLITYVDGTCGTCVNGLLFWKNFLKANNIQDSKCGFLPYIFAFDANDFQKDAIEKLDLGFPWLFDKNSSIVKLNGIYDKRFQTALVNSSGKVLLIGDPVLNPALSELYAKTIKNLQ